MTILSATDTPGRGSPLGHATDYPDRYDPSLLFAVARAPQRVGLFKGNALPFSGVDLWTAYEITWLDAQGRPQVAVGELRFDADSPSMVESKSLKLYLGSFAQERFDSGEALAQAVQRDLERVCGAPVAMTLHSAAQALRVAALPGVSLDALDVAVDAYEPDPRYLACGAPHAEETLRTALFRSKCPVTGQPDYADVMIRYRGPRIERAGLLRYLVSFRDHPAFHEACVEQIFVDIALACRPDQLTVYARFLRRGGIDINPFRSNFELAPSRGERTPRQ
jgi:7-cyano-7-deazaguanine reductase